MKLLQPFAELHHGLVTLDAVRAAGLSRSTWKRAIDAGQLDVVRAGVARISGLPPSPYEAIAAAVLAAGKGAIASHRCAAFLWDIPVASTPKPEVILPRRSRRATLHGVIVHRPRDLLDVGAVIRHGVPTCNLLRLACDIGAVEPASTHRVVGHMVTNGWVSVRDFDRAIRRHGRRGRPGVPALRQALDDWIIDGQALDSELERRMRNLIRRFDLPPVEFHPTILGYEVDFKIVGMPIILECDGYEWHDKRQDRAERDRQRDAELGAAGYTTVRFTWTSITKRPAWVAKMIRGHIAQWERRAS